MLEGKSIRWEIGRKVEHAVLVRESDWLVREGWKESRTCRPASRDFATLNWLVVEESALLSAFVEGWKGSRNYQ